MVILEQLQALHFEGKHGTETCSTCWMRDLCSLAVTCEKWATAAREKLYERTWLVGPDSILHIKKKFKMKAGSRLKLLRRTLRGNDLLAGYVKELKVPDVAEAGLSKKEYDNYMDSVAALVMACPNLERLLGLYPAYNHEFSRLTHALSTRTKLREHIWNIEASPHQRQFRRPSDTSRPSSRYGNGSTAGALRPDEYTSFLSNHSRWNRLETLVIHCQPGGTINPGLLSEVLTSLPTLSHLALSHLPTLPRDLFAVLPPLQSLYLSHLPTLGPADLSLSQVPSSRAAQTITSLSLYYVNITDLTLIARLFSKLPILSTFTLKQDISPSLPRGETIILHPYLASSSLRKLTWDLLIPSDEEQRDATRILARSVKEGGFPGLRVLRAPTDYDGALQAVCRPISSILSPLESMAMATTAKPSYGGGLIDLIDERRKDSGVSVSTTSTTSSSSGADSGYGSLSSRSGTVQSPSPTPNEKEKGKELSRSLRAARQAAQARLENARGQEAGRCSVIVEDWSDVAADACESASSSPVVVSRFHLGGYCGSVPSGVRYDLSPPQDGDWDWEGRNEVGASVGDFLRAAGAEAEMDGHKGMGRCDGRWNSPPSMVMGRGGGGGGGGCGGRHWEHRERVRWRAVEVGRLFV